MSVDEPLTKTVEIDGQRKRVWTEKANRQYSKKRKERYQNDPEYRKAVQERARQRYLKENPEVAMLPEKIRKNLADITSFGETRRVFVELADVGEEFCLTEAEIAAVIERHPQSFQRMVSDGRWPRPVFSIRVNRTKTGVYLLDQARAMVEVYVSHLERSSHYYAKHIETREAMFEASRKELEKTELGQWAMNQQKQ